MRVTEQNGPAREAALDAGATRPVERRSIAGVLVPDTPIISRAMQYARANHEPFLFHHSMRSWLFAVSVAERQKIAHDHEVLAVAVLLHDLGLERAFAGALCRIVETRPATTYDNFASDFGERLVPGYTRPSTVDLLMDAPFTE